MIFLGGIILLPNDTLTTEEVARLLKVSKLTVYDLIKKGELPSYRVGRQIRVEREALQAYKNQSNSVQDDFEQNINKNKKTRSVIISGQDNCLDILAKQLEKQSKTFHPLRSYIGSLDGLIAMYQGKADIVSTHLFDGDTSTYNIPYVRKVLVSKSFLIIHLLKRKAGFFVAKGNPKNITAWKNLKEPSLQFINREAGAGARILLDEQLRLNHLDRSKINGYYNELTSHMDVVSAIASGKADVGIGTSHAAKMANIDFIPMVEESYDLVILKTEENKTLIQTVLQVTQNNDFKKALHSLNYNTENTGKILYEQ